MKRRWRRTAAKWAKWSCTIAAVLVAVVWAASLWWDVRWSREGGHDPFTVWIWSGVLRGEGLHWPAEQRVLRVRTEHEVISIPACDRWRLWWRPAWETGPMPVPNVRMWRGVLPLWIPFVASAIPSGLFWCSGLVATRRLRRHKRCPRCGYSRHGLAEDAVCPECGAAPTPAKT